MTRRWVEKGEDSATEQRPVCRRNVVPRKTNVTDHGPPVVEGTRVRALAQNETWMVRETLGIRKVVAWRLAGDERVRTRGQSARPTG